MLTGSMEDGATPTPTDAVPAAPAAREPVPDLAMVYRTHFAFVWRSLRRLGLREPWLDDASQDVFLTVHRCLHEFEGRSSLKTWLFGIVVNTARRHRRTHARRGDTDPLPDVMPDTVSQGPMEDVARAQAARLVHAFLEGLDDDHREVFVLAELEQMTAPEVAAATGVNVNTVYSRLRAARRGFEQLVTRQRARDPWSRP